MFYKILRFCISGILRAIYRVRVTGDENIPAEGACIISPNHTSAMDCLVLAVVARRQIRFIGKAELFRIPLFGWILRSLGAFPVHRGEGDIAAIKKSLSILADGEILCVFPQGTRCPGERLSDTVSKVKSGVGMMAMRSEAPVLPTYIKTKKNRLCAFRRTEVIFGNPITAEELSEFNGRTKYADASALIFGRLCDIAAESEETA